MQAITAKLDLLRLLLLIPIWEVNAKLENIALKVLQFLFHALPDSTVIHLNCLHPLVIATQATIA
jgi:hypothetical protein